MPAERGKNDKHVGHSPDLKSSAVLHSERVREEKEQRGRLRGVGEILLGEV